MGTRLSGETLGSARGKPAKEIYHKEMVGELNWTCVAARPWEYRPSRGRGFGEESHHETK